MTASISLLVLAIADFAATAMTLQWVRTDLDPIVVPLSAYLRGTGGIWLRGAYYTMAAVLAALAWSSYHVTDARQRSGLTSALFAIAALTLPVVAITTLYEATPQANLAGFVHGQAAQATFLCLVVGMLRLCWSWARDPRLRGGNRTGWALAWLAFLQMWLLALWKQAPHGLMQKDRKSVV